MIVPLAWLRAKYRLAGESSPGTTVASAAPAEAELSTELIQAVEALTELADQELWRLARRAMSREASQELEALHLKQRDEGLSQDEDAARARLVQEYEQTMLIRAQAARLLKDRGHNVSMLLGARKTRQFGSAKGLVEIDDAFDEALEERLEPERPRTNPYPLRGTPIRYDAPTEPVAEDDWDVLL